MKLIKKMYLNLLNYEANNRSGENAQIIALLGIKPGCCIADLGSGGGFFTFKFAEMTGGEGAVYAVDIDRDNLDYLSMQAAKRGIGNIKTVQATESSPMLPENSADIIFARNMFHHVKEPLTYFSNCKRSLKPGGNIVIIDHKQGANNKFSHAVLFNHYTDEQRIIQIMQEAGFNHSKSERLSNHSFNFFSA